MRCVNYHFYSGSYCERCNTSQERKEREQIAPLSQAQKEELREHCKNVLKEEGINGNF